MDLTDCQWKVALTEEREGEAGADGAVRALVVVVVAVVMEVAAVEVGLEEEFEAEGLEMDEEVAEVVEAMEVATVLRSEGDGTGMTGFKAELASMVCAECAAGERKG